MTVHRVALATAARIPDGMADTPALVGALADQGVPADVVPWDGAGVDWDRYGVVVTHATWDWAGRRTEFAAWLAGLAGRGEPGEHGGYCEHGVLANPLALLAWSEDKAYLLDLAARGVDIPRTCRLAFGADAGAAGLRGELGDGPLVVKPAVGGGGHRVWRCEDAAAAAAVAREQLAGEPVMVQGFEASVAGDGEYSAVFFGGRLSHVVRKVPQPGDFRVHRRYGATRSPAGHATWIDAYGRRLLALLPEIPLYVRVDFLLPRPGRPVLMELEMLEPDLYLRDDPGAAARFAAALTHSLRDRAEVAGRASW